MYYTYEIINDELIINSFSSSGVETELPENFSASAYTINESFKNVIITTNEKITILPIQVVETDNVFIDIKIDGKLEVLKSKVPIKTTIKVSQYTIKFVSKQSTRLTSNTMLSRYTQHMPKWSTAYLNDVSTYSKLIFPLFSGIESIYYKTLSVTKDNLFQSFNSEFYTPVNRNTVIFNKDTNSYVPTTINKSIELLTRLELYELPVKRYNLFKSDYLDNSEHKLSTLFNKLFIYSPTYSEYTIVTTNTDNVLTSNRIEIDSACPVLVNGDFNKLHRFTGHLTDSYITNYISCTNNNASYYNPLLVEGTVNKDKKIEVPGYRYNDETKCLESYHSENNDIILNITDIYHIPDMFGFKKFFVTGTQDLLVLKDDGYIYKGLLRKQLETDLKLYTTNNNNHYVSTISKFSETAKDVEFKISTKDLATKYGDLQCVIRFVTDKGTLYLDNLNHWVLEKTDRALSNTNPVYLEVDTSLYNYVSIEIEVEDMVYQASIIRHKIDLYKTETGNIKDMLHNGRYLVLIDNSDKIYRADIIKDYVEIFNKHLSYDNYNPSVNELRNIRDNDIR